MRLILFLLFFGLWGCKSAAQVTSSKIIRLIQDLPAPAADNGQAYTIFYGPGKKSIYAEFQNVISEIMNGMASKAGHKSYLIDLVASRLNDNTDYFSHKIKRNADIEKGMKKSIAVID